MSIEDVVAGDLCDLTEAVARADVEISSGLLGGEFGYGAEFSNDVFEMHPFWWGDCECGYEEQLAEWEELHPHAGACYQTALEQRGGYQAAHDLASEWGLPEFGCAVHCTCGRDGLLRERMTATPHPADCPTVRPNFTHRESGIEVRWYKYIGRGMEFSDFTKQQWRRAIAECEASLALRSVSRRPGSHGKSVVSQP